MSKGEKESLKKLRAQARKHADLSEQNLEWYAPSVEVLEVEFQSYEILSEINFEIVTVKKIEPY